MDPARRNDCPECGATLVAEPGFVTWCDRCEWNLSVPAVELRNRFERVALAAARRLDARLSDRLARTSDLRPRLTTAKATAFAVAAAVHLFTLGLVFGGALVLLTQYTNPFADLLGVAAIGLAYVLRPRLGKPPRDGLVAREDAPSLYGLVDAAADALGTKRVHHIALDADFNAYWSTVGLRRTRILTLGLPLAFTLEPQQLAALIAHELAHARNGDSARGMFVGSAVNALQEIYGALRGTGGSVVFAEDVALLELLSRPLLWLLSLPVQGVLVSEYLLLQQDSQRAEYLADALAADVAGTDAVIGLHEALLNETSVAAAIQRAARREDSDVFDSLRSVIRSLPPRELERRRRVARREETRLTATHPPTGRRIALLERRARARPKVVLSADGLAQIDEELREFRTHIAGRLVDDYRASLY